MCDDWRRDDTEDESEENKPGKDLWGLLANKAIMPLCGYFTGEPCSCSDCGGTSLLDIFVNYADIFHLMDVDELIQKIYKDYKKIDWKNHKDRLKILEKYSKQIVKHYLMAQENVRSGDYDNKFDGWKLPIPNDESDKSDTDQESAEECDQD